MKFEKDPGYLEGDVIVAGKTTRITDGLIRKVVQVKKQRMVIGSKQKRHRWRMSLKKSM